jgi:hypothetical protein
MVFRFFLPWSGDEISKREALRQQNGTTISTHTGWWLTHPSEKYEFVSWDDDIPNIWKNKIHVPNHQPAY